MTNKTLIYTPKKHICIGESVQIDGRWCIRIKKPEREVYEDISIEELLELLIRTKAPKH